MKYLSVNPLIPASHIGRYSISEVLCPQNYVRVNCVGSAVHILSYGTHLRDHNFNSFSFALSTFLATESITLIKYRETLSITDNRLFLSLEIRGRFVPVTLVVFIYGLR